MTEAALASLARGQLVGLDETRRLERHDHKLGDAVRALDFVSLGGIGVHKYDSYLATVSGVDQTRRVEARYAVAKCQTTAGDHEARRPGRQSEGNAGRNESSPAACFQRYVATRQEVEAGVTLSCMARRRQAFVKKPHRNFDHNDAP